MISVYFHSVLTQTQRISGKRYVSDYLELNENFQLSVICFHSANKPEVSSG